MQLWINACVSRTFYNRILDCFALLAMTYTTHKREDGTDVVYVIASAKPYLDRAWDEAIQDPGFKKKSKV